jgi:hypothetical protein
MNHTRGHPQLLRAAGLCLGLACLVGLVGYCANAG